MAKIAYEHLEKSMFSSKQEVKPTWGYVVKRDGFYYMVRRGTVEFSIHASNVIGLFDDNHNIWHYLYD